MTEAHILAIADIPVPSDVLRELAAKAKAKPAAKPSPKPSASPGIATSSHSAASSGSTIQPFTDPNTLLHLLLEGAEERIMVEKAESTLSVEETGTTQVEDTDDGNIA